MQVKPTHYEQLGLHPSEGVDQDVSYVGWPEIASTLFALMCQA